jgi:hypothetical protein
MPAAHLNGDLSLLRMFIPRCSPQPIRSVLTATFSWAEVVCIVGEGKRATDPELLHRIRQRSDGLRREMLSTHGLTDVAVELVKQSRDEG